MKTLIAALALAIAIAAPPFTAPADARPAARKAEPAAGKVERDTCTSWQNEKCYWHGYPLWQWYSS